MPGYIVIHDWDKFQHYGTRTAPWIKFYTELTHDEEWLALSLHRRGILSGLWLEYAMSRCRLRDDTGSLTRRLNGRVTKEDLKALEQAGYLVISASPDESHIASTRARATEQRREDIEENRPEQNGLPVFQISSETDLYLQRLLREIGDHADKNTEKVLRDLANKGATAENFSEAKEALFNSDPKNRAGFAVRTLKNLMGTPPKPATKPKPEPQPAADLPELTPAQIAANVKRVKELQRKALK